jgi:hypothetical protein
MRLRTLTQPSAPRVPPGTKKLTAASCESVAKLRSTSASPAPSALNRAFVAKLPGPVSRSSSRFASIVLARTAFANAPSAAEMSGFAFALAAALNKGAGAVSALLSPRGASTSAAGDSTSRAAAAAPESRATAAGDAAHSAPHRAPKGKATKVAKADGTGASSAPTREASSTVQDPASLAAALARVRELEAERDAQRKLQAQQQAQPAAPASSSSSSSAARPAAARKVASTAGRGALGRESHARKNRARKVTRLFLGLLAAGVTVPRSITVATDKQRLKAMGCSQGVSANALRLNTATLAKAFFAKLKPSPSPEDFLQKVMSGEFEAEVDFILAKDIVLNVKDIATCAVTAAAAATRKTQIVVICMFRAAGVRLQRSMDSTVQNASILQPLDLSQSATLAEVYAAVRTKLDLDAPMDEADAMPKRKMRTEAEEEEAEGEAEAEAEAEAKAGSGAEGEEGDEGEDDGEAAASDDDEDDDEGFGGNRKKKQAAKPAVKTKKRSL